MPTEIFDSLEVFETNVLRFVYHETSEEENVQIREEIFDDEMLTDLFCNFVMIKNELDKLEEEAPSDSVISNILAFSKSFNAEQEPV